MDFKDRLINMPGHEVQPAPKIFYYGYLDLAP